MSQRDLVAELRAARVEAPSEVRERVRLIAAGAPTRRRRVTWRRAFVVAVPVAAAIAATVVFTRPSSKPAAVPGPLQVQRSVITTAPGAAAPKALAVPAETNRVQVIGETLSLHVKDVSGSVQRAVRITT